MITKSMAAIFAAVLVAGFAARDGQPPQLGDTPWLSGAVRVADPALPPGHPPVPVLQLPPGHPPIDGPSLGLPEGHPPVPGMGGDCPAQRLPSDGEFDVGAFGRETPEIIST